MAFNAYLTLTGRKQGPIKGGVLEKGREGQIAVYAFRHNINVPLDPLSGQARGFRQYAPIIITKEIDQSSPALHNMIATNELITDLKVEFYGSSPKPGRRASAGHEALLYTITLTDAVLTGMNTLMENNRVEPGKTLPVLEELAFNFRSIEWLWPNGNFMAADDFLRPGA
ncbi:MAG: type VI secretion system tube protein Hcp [Mucilaginibacter polytrichastri]|nr:type VI secretion system tube protein Hcp [Mucilaginibacter polytrichastri]